MVAESRTPGVSVSVVARRYDVNANQLFTWRREFADVEPDRQEHSFVPVVIPSEAPADSVSRDEGVSRKRDGAPAPEVRGRMEISLAGGIRIVVDRTVDAAALARVLDVLERRPVCRSLGEDR